MSHAQDDPRARIRATLAREWRTLKRSLCRCAAMVGTSTAIYLALFFLTRTPDPWQAWVASGVTVLIYLPSLWREWVAVWGRDREEAATDIQHTGEPS